MILLLASSLTEISIFRERSANFGAFIYVQTSSENSELMFRFLVQNSIYSLRNQSTPERYGYCGHAPIGTHPAFDAQVHTEKEKPQPVRCQCHEKCRVQYACWVGLANLTLCFYCLAARYSAAERDGYESVTPRPGKLGKVSRLRFF